MSWSLDVVMLSGGYHTTGLYAAFTGQSVMD